MKDFDLAFYRRGAGVRYDFGALPAYHNVIFFYDN